MFYLYWDESDPNDPDTSKLRRAAYATLEDAQAQREADVEAGRNVVCIEESDGPLAVQERVENGINVVTFDRGTIVG